jgi:hypothetical protein
LVEGYDAVGLRLWTARTGICADDAFDAAGLDLYADMDEMCAANGVTG